MIPRRIEALVRDRLGHIPAVALLGPRQVGKTTLAHAIAEGRKSVYLDLQSQVDREKLTDAAFYYLSGFCFFGSAPADLRRQSEMLAAL